MQLPAEVRVADTPGSAVPCLADRRKALQPVHGRACAQQCHAVAVVRRGGGQHRPLPLEEEAVQQRTDTAQMVPAGTLHGGCHTLHQGRQYAVRYALR